MHDINYFVFLFFYTFFLYKPVVAKLFFPRTKRNALSKVSTT